jgi:parvulin-like peptidyl-prolyl isomerase
MARRERTTGLPRPRPRVHHTGGHTFAGITWTDTHVRLAILGAALALLFIVAGAVVYHEINYRILTPRHTVLTVGNEKSSLNYYTDRLYQYAQDDQSQASASGGTSTGIALLEQQLLNTLETESLTVQLAKDRGIDLSDDAITKEIADELGVPVGGPGSSFDTLYRAKLKSTHMSDATYRRMAEANLAHARLLDNFSSDLGATGEGITLRSVLVASEDEAKAVVARINAGEDMGSIAQTTSIDDTSKSNDGVMSPVPSELLPQAILDAIKDKQAGPALFGPIQVQNNWWVFRLEKRDPSYSFSDSDKSQLAQLHLNAALTEKRASTPITRNLTSGDVSWALKNAN